MIVIVKRKFFLPDYDYDYDCYSVKKTDYDYDYSEKNRNRLPNRLPIEGDYTSLAAHRKKKDKPMISAEKYMSQYEII